MKKTCLWLGFVLSIPFSALTLMVECHEGHPACKKTRSTNPPDRPRDRPTDHATRSVTVGRMYVRSIAMRRNNV